MWTPRGDVEHRILQAGTLGFSVKSRYFPSQLPLRSRQEGETETTTIRQAKYRDLYLDQYKYIRESDA
jgi:hypothetical protein